MLPKLTLITAVAGTASALLVAPNSPCEQYCGNVLSSTTGSDMVCSDSAYSGAAAGTVFETCIKCELTSAYVSGNTSDLEYLLYNLRYQIAYCTFGLLNNTDVQDSPCITSTACGRLEDAFDWKNMSTAVGPYDYCQNWVEAMVPKCEACLTAGEDYFTRNYITILDAACSQMPDDGSTLSITGTPFSTVPMNITTPSETPLYTYTPPKEAISLGGKVGIAIGGLVLLLSLAGFLIVCLGRRRRRAYLRSIEARYKGGAPGTTGTPATGNMWPSPMIGSHSGFHTDTPMSQRPLRGWDDQSPVSAMDESMYGGNGGGSSGSIDNNGLFPRYFSPYSSQFNSPVSATGGPSSIVWPTMEAMAAMHSAGKDVDDGQPGPSNSRAGGYTQEEIERTAHERQLAHIGAARGGTDPSLHIQNEAAAEAEAVRSLAAPQNAFHPASVHGLSAASSLSSLSVSAGVLWERPGKAKLINVASPTIYTQDPQHDESSQGASSSESYELREVDSHGNQIKNKGIATGNTPILQHPGHGRGGSMRYYPPPPPPQMSDPYDTATAHNGYGSPLPPASGAPAQHF